MQLSILNGIEVASPTAHRIRELAQAQSVPKAADLKKAAAQACRVVLQWEIPAEKFHQH
jgi:hypothetical protein